MELNKILNILNQNNLISHSRLLRSHPERLAEIHRLQRAPDLRLLLRPQGPRPPPGLASPPGEEEQPAGEQQREHPDRGRLRYGLGGGEDFL